MRARHLARARAVEAALLNLLKKLPRANVELDASCEVDVSSSRLGLVRTRAPPFFGPYGRTYVLPKHGKEGKKTRIEVHV